MAVSDVCQYVGDPMPDIAGIGILVGFAGQAFLSLFLACWVFFLTRHGRLGTPHTVKSDKHAVEKKRLEMVEEILMIGNDMQMAIGIALMITTFTVVKTIDIYHLRLIYDTVSFVGVSNVAALVCYTFCAAKRAEFHESNINNNKATSSPSSGFLHGLTLVLRDDGKNPIWRKFIKSGRYRVTYAFAVLFFALAVLLNNKLGHWDLATPGRCYNTAATSSPGAHHPSSDRAYVWITCVWMLAVMLFSVFEGGADKGETEGSENNWDFGQTTAVLLLFVAVAEFFRKGYGLYKFEKNLRKRRRLAEDGEVSDDHELLKISSSKTGKQPQHCRQGGDCPVVKTISISKQQRRPSKGRDVEAG
ncbi:hypothetical protein CMQ_524 [Grosmannia clavigera kw1407]|uniref:Uncharacterized protein n=1 Tax=Grosmannia clavigera (strain kw1407 / UAMH 11150) TaxID=655863 RepID=F0XCL4_GROCL|nr:uncharacterized protein CMQ_524 [Grosmannia clavigera kw1407]EFX03596.1 hypothetical protein CMQ_524 [Grosmannia clavigera kw1407]